MQFNSFRPREGLVRKHLPAKLDWKLASRRDLTGASALAFIPRGPPDSDPNLPTPKDPAAAEPSPPPDGGPEKPQGPPRNGTDPIQSEGNNPPPTPGKGPKKEKAPPLPPPPPPPNPAALTSDTIPPPAPPTGTSALPSESGFQGPEPTSLLPPPLPTPTTPTTPKTPKPRPTGPPPGPKGNRPPPPSPASQSTLSTSIIAATAAPNSLPTTAGGGISSNTGSSNGAIVNAGANTSPINRAQSQATIAASVVVIISRRSFPISRILNLTLSVGSIALIVGFMFLLRRIKRRRRLGLKKEAYLTTSPLEAPMPIYSRSGADNEYLPPINRSISYPIEQYTEAYAPVIIEGRTFTKRVGIGSEGTGGQDEKVLANMPASVISEATLQNRNSVLNSYSRDVKVQPVQMPRDF